MRLYRVVLRSGANMDITAKSMRDDPDLDVIYFFHDERKTCSRPACNATSWRD